MLIHNCIRILVLSRTTVPSTEAGLDFLDRSNPDRSRFGPGRTKPETRPDPCWKTVETLSGKNDPLGDGHWTLDKPDQALELLSFQPQVPNVPPSDIKTIEGHFA